jgi:hypothetical protein
LKIKANDWFYDLGKEPIITFVYFLRIFLKRWEPHCEDEEYGGFIECSMVVLPRKEETIHESIQDQRNDEEAPHDPMEDQAHEEPYDVPIEDQGPLHSCTRYEDVLQNEFHPWVLET